jgi:hypothetical protein
MTPDAGGRREGKDGAFAANASPILAKGGGILWRPPFSACAPLPRGNKIEFLIKSKTGTFLGSPFDQHLVAFEAAWCSNSSIRRLSLETCDPPGPSAGDVTTLRCISMPESIGSQPASWTEDCSLTKRLKPRSCCLIQAITTSATASDCPWLRIPIVPIKDAA